MSPLPPSSLPTSTPRLPWVPPAPGAIPISRRVRADRDTHSAPLLPAEVNRQRALRRLAPLFRLKAETQYGLGAAVEWLAALRSFGSGRFCARLTARGRGFRSRSSRRFGSASRTIGVTSTRWRARDFRCSMKKSTHVHVEAARQAVPRLDNWTERDGTVRALLGRSVLSSAGALPLADEMDHAFAKLEPRCRTRPGDSSTAAMMIKSKVTGRRKQTRGRRARSWRGSPTHRWPGGALK